ncbi:hypothetical protein ACD591_04185 [Rufibacter glacialis]|uniref:Chromosome segregation protein SMC n=1 Tax=Rufibacter glacialis TaxID=1259555 RepID=A0A5M8QEX3_9BACT|nr:hypothetical protein [Rufibacter glacialis]KAA6434559.1 hypothetical protein FOE74_10250 [Rufibacter glacialis]GGK70667.1 hypothetical protein GCM10011405_18420 [Rufibacter glacialis]
MATETPEKDSNRKLLVVGLIIVLLSINGILIYMQQQKTQESEEQKEIIKVKSTELENQIKVFETLKADYERQKAELGAMGLTNDSLETRIAAINADLAQLRAFRNSSFTVADQRRFQQRAQNLELALRKKDEEVAKLQENNEELFTEVTGLKTTQNKLSDSITSLATNNKELEAKVNLASKLEAQNIAVTIINPKGKEKEDSEEEYKAKKVDKIKLSFKLGKNEVAAKENKEILMRLIEPDGAAVYNLATGSGTFEFEGKEQFYTAKRDIIFDNTQQQVSFIYSKGAPFKTGKHLVEIYSDGFLIGTTSFTLK